MYQAKRFNISLSRPAMVCLLSLAILATTALSAYATANRPGLLSAFRPAEPPAGFVGICARYGWACASTARKRATAQHALALAQTVNDKVNRAITPKTDYENYGRREHWTLPYNGAGDCEDYALLKKKLLIEAGLSPTDLLLATVAGPMPEAHVVLVLRTDQGDYVLDNLSSRITTWQSSRYTFMKMQRPEDKRRWDYIMLGPRAVRW